MPTSSEPNEFLQEVAVETTESCSSSSSRKTLGSELQVEEATPSRGGDAPIDKDLTLVITPSESREKDCCFKEDLDCEHAGLYVVDDEPKNLHLDAAILRAEPTGTHSHIDSSYSEPGCTHSNQVPSCSPPSSTRTNCSNAIGKPTLTHSAVRPYLTGSFPAQCSHHAELPPKPRNLTSRAMTITERVVGRQFHLLPVVSMFLTVLRPIRYLIPESIRAKLLSQETCHAQFHTQTGTLPTNLDDTTLALTTMSGQLCFTSRYGPFSERLDDEVTFQLSAENQGSDLQGVDNLAFESDQLIGDQSFGTNGTTRNGATIAFQSHVNKDRSSSSDESFGSQESIPEIVPLGQPWRALGWFFSRTIVSVVILFLMTGVSLALAGISVFVVGPTPYFDKSLNAFQIPNHVSTQRQMAFDKAKKDDFKNLPKRSADDQIGAHDFLKYWDSDDGNDIFNSLLRKTNSEIEGIPVLNSNSYYAKQKSDDLFINDNEEQANNAPRSKRGLDEGKTSHARQRRSAPRYRSMRWRIQLVYIAEGEDKNIFTKERLETIHNIEMSIMNHPNFTFFCSRNTRSFKDPALAPYKHCVPPNSLMTYFYPSEVDSKIIYDGVGSKLADINGTLAHAMTEATFYWYVDTSMNTKNRRSKFIRSEVWFGTPIGEVRNSLTKDEVSQVYKDFVVTYIDLLNTASTDKVRVLYGGTQLFDYEVSQTITHDLSLSIPTGAAIFILLFILTSFSVWLTIWGFASILLSFAWAYFVYHVAFGKAALGLLNLVSAFVIIGIGVDDVFVFVNTFLQADHYSDPVQRMAHTIKTAGIATFFTSFTTAGAFAANIASQIPAINDFGLFMCLIVSFCWLLVVLIMPCALTLWHRCFHCEVFIFGRCSRGKNDPAAAMANLSRVLARHERQATQQQAPPEGEDLQSSQEEGGEEGSSPRETRDDNDIPLLDLEEFNNTQNLLIEDDEPLILTNDDEFVSSIPPASTPTKQTRSITKTLQSILYNFVATPVIKGRWVVVVCYLVIFAISLGLVVHINPANRPPALYNQDTNLQQLLDLAYNFSGSDVACRSCSGFSSDGVPSSNDNSPVTLPAVIPIPTRRPTSTSAPQQGGMITTKVTPRPPVDTLSPIISNPPGVSYKPTTEHGGVVTAAPTDAIHQTCAEVGPTCEFRSTCHEGDATSEPVCRCIFHCSSVSDPVCGSNGQTYTNLCDLQAYGCSKKLIIDKAHSGVCYNPHSPDSGHPDTHGQTTRPSSHGGASSPQGEDNSQAGGGEEHASSPDSGFNPCAGGSCGTPAVRPALDNLALVYVVFGIDHIDLSAVSKEHVVAEDEGHVIYDNNFNILSEDTLRALCKICKNVAARTELVEEGGAHCFPNAFASYINAIKLKFIECRDLPVPNLLAGTRSKSLLYKSGSRVVWFAMAFQSKTFMGQSSFDSYKDYNNWDKVMKEEIDGLSNEEKVGLETMFQTSSYWKQIFMEIVGVSSAIYGVAFSLLVCVVAVVIFTAHIGILLIAFLTIGGVILVVISMFYLLGWEMGAVEAVSLSILVGSSVDYCIHLIEGYLVAGDRVPDSSGKTAAEMRNWRIRHSVSTIGVSILSSAVTTIIASIPLCFTTIQIFAKFGKIVAMNTFVSIFYTLTACTAFLSIAGPARYQWNLKWFVFSTLVLCVLIGAVVAALFVLHTSGVSIPGPSGSPLF